MQAPIIKVRNVVWGRLRSPDPNEADLHKLSREAEGTSPVEPLEEPGGGLRVWLREPNGFLIEVIWGLTSLPVLPARTSLLNTGPERCRLGELQRIEPQPCEVKRKRGEAALLPARPLDVLGRLGARGFELTLWIALTTTRRALGIAGSRF